MKPSQRTLLQVEDNPANVLLVEELLARRSDLKLVTAVDGYQGIEMACSHKPDVILMDINLPDISGLSALKILRENPTTAHIPVIALSSNAYPSQIDEGLEAGFFRYMTKLFKVDEFMEAIDVALRYAVFISRGHSLFLRQSRDGTGIAIGRAQAQHPLSAMLGSAESVPNRRYRPNARREQD